MTQLRRILVLAMLALACARFGQAGEPECLDPPDDTFAFINSGNDSCPANPEVSWPAATVTYDCDFFTDDDKGINCSGDDATCVNLCRAATDAWNADLLGRFTFVNHTDPDDFCDTEDGRVSVGGTAKLCDGSSFGSNVLAVTLSIFFSAGPQAGQLIDANITVNQRFAFTQASFQATLAHEFGHVLGLSHPDQCDKDFNVLMRSASCKRSNEAGFVLDPTDADVKGAERIYPVVGPTPGICGDADLSGAITVTDGVQTLRAAAELSSSCTAARCDVDGNGPITVSDGVNVLRAAADLPITSNCP
ncbi:MAG: hypothetical protein ABIR79_15245 [Candidatus Binatia bacterium]